MRPENVSAKRQMLARKNYGRRQASEFLSNLSLAVAQKLDVGNLVPLEKTDDLYAHFTESFRLAMEDKILAYRQSWPSSEKDELELKLKCFRSRAADDEVFLFSKGFDYSGALRLNLHTALDHVFELILVDRDCLSLLHGRKENGLLIDTNEDLEKGNDEYELIIWGDDWLSAINKC
jgi:hypothetical protein